ncbi:MFS transporter [Sediminispirochaeta smaragdinae]|uniref:Major facilitator superfamily MFS_1 n=1 Tax=Sediminispirochaeta smaragdinae (strain DSM 11293 / JCM 15392 / SEBR 4228) TaxID=573413 RepID=E1R7Q4_SEDSS|nr:MFS transporter [Sediminispirochaeta smaragdinae]ADK82759.1 major facilitator superfamily MFS_1 [Sediminispirochaeta smaragdinae DSM 11293]
MKKKEGMRQYYGITFLIGLGFFTMGLMDPLYDTYVPMFLSNFISMDSIVGTVMGLDNLFALLLIPIVSALSDRTRTPIGRRMPYIIVTLPATALFFGLLPYSALTSLVALILAIFFLNLFKQAARGPVVALMPDMIPGEYRSEANGVINTMGGIAAIVGTVGLAKLYDLNVTLPLFGATIRSGGAGSYIGTLPFLLSALLVLLAVLLLFLFVKEKQVAQEHEQEEKVPIWKSLHMIIGTQDKSALFILVSLLLWFIGYQGVLPWIGIYSREFLGLKPGTAALSAGMVGIAYAIFAIPSGILAHRIGRKRAIRGSLFSLTLVTVLLFLHHPLASGILGLTGMPLVLSFWLLLFLFGIFWVTVVTNSFPMLWQMASYGTMGIYTGLYYFFSQSAGIIAPGFSGAMRDLFGDRSMFLTASCCMFAAFLVMGLVRKGEAEE